MLRLLTSLALLTGLCPPFAALAFPQAGESSREGRLAAMRGIAQRFKVGIADTEQPRELPLHESPLLRFNDPAREFHDATLWAWCWAVEID